MLIKNIPITGAQGDTGVPPIVICPGDTVDMNGNKQTTQGNECRCPPGTEDDGTGTNTCAYPARNRF